MKRYQVNRPHAFISVFNKQNVVDLASRLEHRGYGIISTGGTQTALVNGGLTEIIGVSELTEAPECLGGRLKTLHPKVHGSILYRRDDPQDLQTVKDEGFVNITIVAVNLYPFKEVISRPGATFEDAIENIDIGGPTMLRAAAKNFKHVYVVSEPGDYKTLIGVLDSGDAQLQLEFRFRMAAKVFATMTIYESAIARYLGTRTP